MSLSLCESSVSRVLHTNLTRPCRARVSRLGLLIGWRLEVLLIGPRPYCLLPCAINVLLFALLATGVLLRSREWHHLLVGLLTGTTTTVTGYWTQYNAPYHCRVLQSTQVSAIDRIT